MTIVARDLEQEKRRAWDGYADRVRDLHGAEYERAEQDAWERLQETLDTLDAGEAALAGPPVG
jgi:hypothetical protein